MPGFQNPFAFLLLLLIPVLYILRKFKIFKKITLPAVLSDWNGKTFEWNGRLGKFLSVLANVFVMAGVVLTITALADPVYSHQEKIFNSVGTDIIFVVDSSPSMAAKDMNGITRLESAKASIKQLAQENEGIRFGLVVFGSEAAVYVPPTADHSVFIKKIEEIQVGILGNGSAIGDGLSTAVCHLVSSPAPKKVVVLLTDGENNAGEIHPETAASLAASNEITVYVVGVGTKGSVPIEYTDPSSGKLYSGYLDSNFNSASLRKIAGMGNGRYFEVMTIDELKECFEAVAKIESVAQNFSYKTVNQSLYKNFVLAAILLFILSWIIKRLFLREVFFYRYKKSMIFRTVFHVLAFSMLVLSYMGLHWGTYLVPVQKNGTAVSFVFDISNSMLAKDGSEEMTRLQASSEYAKKLLTRMPGTPVSVVLAKGDGVAAIPLTDDYVMIESLLEVLSPSLMTVPGTSLGKGITKAEETFPKNYSNAGRIWVFTDGEETDKNLKGALSDCIKNGIPVSIIGFGEEKETEVLTGDGKTVVKSALRAKEIENTLAEAAKNLKFYKKQTEVSFIPAMEKGSAIKLLSQLKENENQIVSYEAKPVPRFKLFLIFAVLFFAFSFIFTEFDFSKLKLSGLAGLLVLVSLCGCSGETGNVLKGTQAFSQQQYHQAVADFMTAADTAKANEDTLAYIYSLYDLGTAYSKLDEDAAAMEKFALIPENADDNVRFAAYYNAGVICHRNEDYEQAMNYFRKALEVDNTRLEAKINLELSIKQVEVNVKHNESQAIPASEENSAMPEMEKAVFERIKENDQKQWKNSESNQNQNLSEDY